MRSKTDYWLSCSICRHCWVGQPYDEQEYTEKCPECNSEEFEIEREYRSFDWPSPFWVLLLIPNVLLFGSL